MEPAELMNERNKVHNSSVETSEQNVMIDVEDWKMAIIEKMRDQTKNKKQKRKPVSKSSVST